MSTWTPMDVPADLPGRAQDDDAYADEHTAEPTDVGPSATSAPDTTAAPGTTPSAGTAPFPGTTPSPGATPTPGTGLRASDADRDQVAGLLGAAYAEGRLTHEEHDERLGRVLAARTFDDLIPLTADLVPLDPAPATVSSATPQFVVGQGRLTEPDRMVAVFGGVERRGRWRVRARSQITAIFGGVDLDLREADFDAPVVEFVVQTCFGGVDLKVPAGITVRNETVNIFGGTEIRNIGEPVEGAPTLVVRGTVLFGGVTVKGPRPRRFGRGTARPGLATPDPRQHRMHDRHDGR